MALTLNETSAWWMWAAGFVTGAGFFGAFVDFYLGKSGQERFKTWLTKWWDRFDDVDVSNFSAKEAEFFLKMMDKEFPPYGVIPWRMLGFCLVVCYAFMAVIVATRFFQKFEVAAPDGLILFGLLYTWMAAAGSLFLLIKLTKITANFAGKSHLGLVGNIIVQLYVCIPILFAPAAAIIGLVWIDILFQGDVNLEVSSYIQKTRILIYFPTIDFLPPPIMKIYDTFEFVSGIFRERVVGSGVGLFNIFGKLSVMRDSMGELLKMSGLAPYIPYFESHLIVLFLVGLLRLMFSMLFFFSCFTRFLKTPVSTIWARIIESDKPVFTLLCSGSVAIVKITEGAFHLMVK